MTDEETEAALALQLTLPVCSAFAFFRGIRMSGIIGIKELYSWLLIWMHNTEIKIDDIPI